MMVMVAVIQYVVRIFLPHIVTGSDDDACMGSIYWPTVAQDVAEHDTLDTLDTVDTVDTVDKVDTVDNETWC